MRTPVIHPIPAKENPRSKLRGLRWAIEHVREAAAQPPTSALMMSPNSSHRSPLNFIN